MATRQSEMSESDESYFVSMTDLMMGVLFVFIIMLMSFSLKMRQQETKFASTTESLSNANKTRSQILNSIHDALLAIDESIRVEIDLEQGVLRLPEQMLFPQGAYQLTPKGKEALAHLARVLAQLLPHYAKEGEASSHLEAVFIEGHTDDVPIVAKNNKGIQSNWELSTARAIATYKALTQTSHTLDLLRNDSEQKILGVSGYAEYRPVRTEPTAQARAANRRIDLRFLMATPTTAAIEKLREDIIQGAETP